MNESYRGKGWKDLEGEEDDGKREGSETWEERIRKGEKEYKLEG